MWGGGSQNVLGFRALLNVQRGACWQTPGIPSHLLHALWVGPRWSLAKMKLPIGRASVQLSTS